MNDDKQGRSAFKDSLVGRLILGRYHVVRRLASGGMGVVYLARYGGAHGFARPVVLKTIMPQYAADEKFLGLFIREAKIQSALRDPGIVEVIDFGQEEDFYVMVLEYVHGFELLDWSRYRSHQGKVFSIDIILQIMIGILEPLHRAHTYTAPDGKNQAIIHRDISPSNVMLTNTGHVKIVDFGIAHMANMTTGYKTQAGVFKGKLSYSAPERFGDGPLAPRCDIYSAGVMLHELLVGRNELYTGDHASTIARVLNHRLSSILHRRPDAPPGLDDIIQRAVAKDPADRFDSALTFANEIRELLCQSEAEVKAKLTQLTSEDFTDDMAAFLGSEPLSVRDRAWRQPSEAPRSIYPSLQDSTHIDFRPAIPGEPTERVSAFAVSPQAIAESARRMNHRGDNSRSMEIRMGHANGHSNVDEENAVSPSVVLHIRPSVIVWLVTVLLLIIGGFIAYWDLIVNSDSDERGLVVVQEQVDAAPRDVHDMKGGHAAMPVDATTDNTMTVEPNEDKTAELLSSENLSEAEQALLLTNVFQKKQGDVERCIAANRPLLDGTNQILIRFSVATDGRVSKTSLIPARFIGTPIEKCIVGIASALRFPPMKKPISFAIPVLISEDSQQPGS
ncbi:MAG: serine/threonine protein kinase [Deltaproteobacteria bacterium]|nr:serine/threonine protein kinase [Deltaproteobacteria bacterium]